MHIRFDESIVSWRDFTYRKIADLPRGGSSNVYLMLATSGPHKGIFFAVKVFKALARPGWRLNFMREASFLRSCDHPAIMRVFDEGLYRDENPFLVMEYLPETLSKAMKNRSLRDLDRISYVAQLLSALNYLARLDPPIVHRDIKPSNIFLKMDSCVLGDFGLLLPFDDSVASANMTRNGLPEMAKYYRTPELLAYQLRRVKPPPKSDLFQLGLVAAELFTGRNPLLPDEPLRPLRLEGVGQVPGPLGAHIASLIKQMLIEETDNRPSSAELTRRWQELHLEALRRGERERTAQSSRSTPENQSPS